MILLFDENILYRIVKKIKDIFPRSFHVSDITPVLKDDLSIFKYAKHESMVIVTHDEDFYELQLIHVFPPKIIWLRMGNTSTLNIQNKLIEKKESIISFEHNDELGILEIY